jgi:hypothetical protein
VVLAGGAPAEVAALDAVVAAVLEAAVDDDDALTERGRAAAWCR